MKAATNGNRVSVSYCGRLEDGTEFDSASDSEPISFVIGGEDIIAGFDEAVMGMKVGEQKKVTLSPEQAYGERNDGLVVTVKKEQLPKVITPEIGQQVKISQANGGDIIMMITEVAENTVTLDGNHPLAGKNLVFELKLVAIDG